MRNPGRLLVVLAVAALLGVGVTAQEAETYWPQWRGPEMTGVAPHGDPPVEWSEGHNVAWKVEIPGRGLGTPVIWGDLVFLLTAVEAQADGTAAPEARIPAASPAAATPAASPVAATPAVPPTSAPEIRRPQRQRRRGRRPSGPQPVHEFVVMALSRDDGSIVWQRTATVERPHQGKRDNNSFASASAVTDGEYVFGFFGSRGLYAYDLQGELQWETNLGDMQIRGAFGEGATPALHGDTLVVPWDHQGPSFIVALDKRTGEELWRQERDEIDTWATPLVVETDGGTQVITAGTNRVRSYDLATGEIVWEGDGLTMNPIPSPVFSDGVAYLTSGYRGNTLRAVRLADARGEITGSEAVLWEYDRDTPYVPSPLLYGENFYMLKSNSAILTNMDPRTGRPHYGPVRLEGLAEVYASPVGAAGRVYLLGRDGNALVIADGPEFEVLARNSLDDGFDASPAVAGDELYLRGYRFLYRISED